MSDITQVAVPAPYEGVDLSQPPHTLAPTRTRDLLNWLVHNNNKIIMRGPVVFATQLPTTNWSGAPLSSVVIAQAAVLHDGLVVLSTVEPTSDVRTWSHKNYQAGMPQAPQLFTSAKHLYFIPNTGTYLVATGAETQYSPGLHTTRYRNQLWTIAGNNPGDIRITYLGRAHGAHPLVHVDGSPATPPSSMVLATGTNGRDTPRGGEGIAAYAERLFAFGGMPAGSAIDATHDVPEPAAGGSFTTQATNTQYMQASKLWFTNIDADAALNASWKTAGVNNGFQIGPDDPGDYPMGLAAATRALICFKRNSVWQLTGTGSDSFAVRQLSSFDGLVDPRAKTVVGDTVYYVSATGLSKIEGTTLTNISERVSDLLRPAIRAAMAEPQGFVRVDYLPQNGYLLVTAGRQAGLTNGVTGASFFHGLYHIASARWAMVSSSVDGLASPFPTVFSPTPALSFGAHGQSLYNISAITDPSVSPAAQYGSDVSSSNQGVPFPLRARLAPVRLGFPSARSQLVRLCLEYAWAYSDAGAVSTHPPYVALERYGVQSADETGKPDLELAAARLAEVVDTGAGRPQHKWIEGRGELADASVLITRDDNDTTLSAGLSVAEVYGAILEVQSPTHRIS